MKHRSVSASIRIAIACVLASGASTAPPAAAEIFKCLERSGVERYQNFPCSIDSLGSLPAPPSTARPANTGEPAVGMTQADVRALWGEPEETDQDEIKKGRIEIWRYADGRSVHFDRKHRVLEVQR